MRYINLTPHKITIRTRSGRFRNFPPSGIVARLAETINNVSTDGQIDIAQVVYGPVVNLPEPAHETYYIVSTLVRLYQPHRVDLISPIKINRRLPVERFASNPAVPNHRWDAARYLLYNTRWEKP